MSLKDLQKKIKRKMSAENKKLLIAELSQEILKICPWTYDPAEDAERARKIEQGREERRKELGEEVWKTLKSYPDYPKNDLSKIDNKDLTKQELLENLGCMIMQELFPMNLRLQMLNAHEVFRREIKEAKEKGLPEPHKNLGGFHQIEPKRDKLERCFGICEDQNRRF